jgi:GTP cyclohydrolase IA
MAMGMTATELDRYTDPAPAVDLDAATRAVRDLLVALGRDPDADALAATPQRVAHACARVLAPRTAEPVIVANDDGYDDLVLARDIPFVSLCSRHLLPLRGVAHVGYLPHRRIAERSALTRIVERCAADLQSQERLTQLIAQDVVDRVAPKGAAVVLEAEHLCTTAHESRSRSVTTAVRGVLRDDVRARFEFFTLTRRGRTEFAPSTHPEVP